MQSFVKRLFKQVLVFFMMIMTLMLFATPSYADECGSSDRAPLPSCATAQPQGSEGGVEVSNYCDAVITVKWDLNNTGDEMKDIFPGSSQTEGQGEDVQGVYCCPNYSQCVF